MRGSDARFRLVFAYSVNAFDCFGTIPNAPAGHKSARDGRVVKVDRNGVVQYTSFTTRRHRPTIRTSVMIQPILHLRKLLPQSCRRHSNPDPNWEAALRVPGRDLRCSQHAACPYISAEERDPRPRSSRPLISTLDRKSTRLNSS